MLKNKMKKTVTYYLDIIGLYNSKSGNDSRNAKSILNYFGNIYDSSANRFKVSLKEEHIDCYKLMIVDTRPRSSGHDYGTLTISPKEYSTFVSYLSLAPKNIRNNILDVE